MTRDSDDDRERENAEKLAAKIAKMSEAQRQTFNRMIALVANDRPPESPFQHNIADTVLKNLLPGMQEKELGHFVQQERDRIREQERDDRNTAAYANEMPTRPPNSHTMEQFIPRSNNDRSNEPGQQPTPPSVSATRDQPDATRSQANQNTRTARHDFELGIYDPLKGEPVRAEEAPVKTTVTAPDLDRPPVADAQDRHDVAKALAPSPNTHADRQEFKIGIYDDLKQIPIAREPGKSGHTPGVLDTNRNHTPVAEGQPLPEAGKIDQQLRSEHAQAAQESVQTEKPAPAPKPNRNPEPDPHVEQSEIAKTAEIAKTVRQPLEPHIPEPTPAAKEAVPPETNRDKAPASHNELQPAKTDEQLRADLTPERLTAILDRLERVAHHYDIWQDRDFKQEKAELAKSQHTRQQELEGKGPPLLEQDRLQHQRIQHQHRTEYVSLEANYLARKLADRDPAESARCRDESVQTARVAKLIGNDIDHARRNPSARDVVQRQDEDAKSKAGDAVRSGRTMTDAERASAPPEAKNQLDANEKAEAKRNPDKLSKEHEAMFRAMREGNAKDTGRGGDGRGR